MSIAPEKYDGIHCPNCGSEEIIVSDSEWSWNCSYQNIQCIDCGVRYTEVYKLAGYDNLEPPDPSDEG